MIGRDQLEILNITLCRSNETHFSFYSFLFFKTETVGCI